MDGFQQTVGPLQAFPLALLSVALLAFPPFSTRGSSSYLALFLVLALSRFQADTAGAKNDASKLSATDWSVLSL